MSAAMDVASVIGNADSEFPALFQLFGGYFHRDWRDEYDTPAAALSAFLEEAPPAAVREAVVELDRLLELPLGQDGLGRLLRQGFDCNYMPSTDGLDDSQWLRLVRERLQPRDRR